MNATVWAANWPVLLLLVAGIAVIVGLVRAERAAKYGRHMHAHADGTVHEHARGHRHHRHPTPVERYDAWLTRHVGPNPHHTTHAAPAPDEPATGGEHRPGCPCTCP